MSLHLLYIHGNSALKQGVIRLADLSMTPYKHKQASQKLKNEKEKDG